MGQISKIEPKIKNMYRPIPNDDDDDDDDDDGHLLHQTSCDCIIFSV